MTREVKATGTGPAPWTATDRRILLLSGLVGLVLRFLSLPGLTREGLRLLSMDDYGHLRRSVATLRDFPHVPVFDPYLNHPEGGIWIWPPLFDLLIAGPAGVLFGAEAEVEEVTLVAALLPPFLGVLSLVPLFSFVDRTLGRGEARWAVGLYSVLPAAVIWSCFGHSDQHAGEALAFLLVLAAGARVVGSSNDDRRGVVLLALALAGAVLTWQGAVFLVPVVAGASLGSGRERRVSLALLAAALVTLLVALPPVGPVTYVSFGLFQPMVVALVGALLLLASVSRWGIPLAGVMGVGVILIWPPLANGVRHLLSATQGGEMEAGGYLAYPSEWLRLIAEYRPLFQGGPGRPLSQLSLGLVLVPVQVWLWGRRAWREAQGRACWLLLAFSSLVVTLMALSQSRYAYYLVVVVAIALAATATAIQQALGATRWGATRRDATRWGVMATNVLRWSAAPVFIVLALLPTVSTLWGLPRTQGAAGSDVFLTLKRLAVLDPPPHDSLRPHQVRPGAVRGVLAPWSLGPLVTLFAQRPVVADTFGYGFLRQSEVFTAPPEMDREVERWLREWNCRYVITTDLRAVLPLYARAVHRDETAVAQMLAVRLHESPDPRPVPFLTLALSSQTGWLNRQGEWIPRLKVYRVEAVRE